MKYEHLSSHANQYVCPKPKEPEVNKLHTLTEYYHLPR